jgi:AcrR family transcriptional regulator
MTAKGRPKATAPTRPGRLSAEQAAELPDRLLDAALSLFTERGYGDTTMEQIAKRAGASTKTIYSRYANKAEILRAVVTRIVERTIALHGAETPGDPADIEPLTFLTSLGRQIDGRISGDAAALNQLALAEARRFPEFAALHKAVVGRGAGIIRHALEQWRKDGRLPWLDDAERAAHLCMTMLTDPARIRSALGEPMPQPEINEHVTYAAKLFLRGCGYKDP